MKILAAVVVLALASFVSVAQAALPSSIHGVAETLSSMASSSAPLVESKGRTGSKRVGGYTSKGKGSRYIGGRRR
jgi:hypothetical protein